jgi:hypothetical protein
VPKKPDTFEQFWHHYLRDHARRGTRALHFFGIGVGITSLILGTIMLNPMIAILGLVLGYVFAWSGHLLIERNRPSMLTHPLWSLQCDVRMLRLWLSGRLGEERARASL